MPDRRDSDRARSRVNLKHRAVTVTVAEHESNRRAGSPAEPIDPALSWACSPGQPASVGLQSHVARAGPLIRPGLQRQMPVARRGTVYWYQKFL